MRVIGVLGSGLLVVVLTACGGAEPEVTPTESASASASAEARSARTGQPHTGDATGDDATGDDAAGEDAAGEDATGDDAAGEDAAGDAVIAFRQVHDELASDHEADARQALQEVASGRALDQAVVTIRTTREQELVQTGQTSVTVVDVTEVAARRYEVTVCLDFSEVLINGDEVDRSGFGGDRQQITYVVQGNWESRGKLVVTEDPLEFTPCMD